MKKNFLRSIHILTLFLFGLLLIVPGKNPVWLSLTYCIVMLDTVLLIINIKRKKSYLLFEMFFYAFLIIYTGVAVVCYGLRFISNPSMYFVAAGVLGMFGVLFLFVFLFIDAFSTFKHILSSQK